MPKSPLPQRMRVPPGTISHRNRVLVASLPWEVITFDRLPDKLGTLKAHLYHSAIAKHFSGKPRSIEEAREILGGRAKIGVVNIPTLLLAAQIMNDPDRRFSFDHFEAYHRFYIRREKKRCKPILESQMVWPLVLRGNRTKADEKETIWDGWHRFHSYYARGLQEIPALWYADKDI